MVKQTNLQKHQKKSLLFLIGDSDIDRWPSHLLPLLGKTNWKCVVSGHSGATLEDILPIVAESLRRAPDRDLTNIILVICAGENNIGNGILMSVIEESFQKLLKIVFGESVDYHDSDFARTPKLIFLGPKIEPWLQHDAESRKQYIQLSRCFERICYQHDSSKERILYLDCLTMFCGDTAILPGALLGGKALAETPYFDADQLHLSEKGYKIWKERVEDSILKLTSC